MAEKIGRRYGVLGFEKKGSKAKEQDMEGTPLSSTPVDPAVVLDPAAVRLQGVRGQQLAGDVANAVGAYVIVKASRSSHATIAASLTPRLIAGTPPAPHRRQSMAQSPICQGICRPNWTALVAGDGWTEATPVFMRYRGGERRTRARPSSRDERVDLSLRVKGKQRKYPDMSRCDANEALLVLLAVSCLR